MSPTPTLNIYLFEDPIAQVSVNNIKMSLVMFLHSLRNLVFITAQISLLTGAFDVKSKVGNQLYSRY
jgi:hypothetical protein